MLYLLNDTPLLLMASNSANEMSSGKVKGHTSWTLLMLICPTFMRSPDTIYSNNSSPYNQLTINGNTPVKSKAIISKVELC